MFQNKAYPEQDPRESCLYSSCTDLVGKDFALKTSFPMTQVLEAALDSVSASPLCPSWAKLLQCYSFSSLLNFSHMITSSSSSVLPKFVTILYKAKSCSSFEVQPRGKLF